MQADNDGDSRMSSAASSPSIAPATSTSNSNGKRPITTISNGAADQENAHSAPTALTAADAEAEEIANMANGAASNTAPLASRGASRKAVAPASTAEYPPMIHEASGYTWTRDEDMPGWDWTNKKAVDEADRAMDVLVHKDAAILNKYGDPFDMAEKEAAETS